MNHKKIVFFLALFCIPLFAAEQAPKKEAAPAKSTAGFATEDSYIDVSEAIRSRQYVRRAILSSVVKNTSRFSFQRPYFNHLMGYNAIFQRNTQAFTKYQSGLQGVSLGYILENGLAVEGGLEFSAVSNAFAGFRYIYRPEKLTLWPFLGLGAGTEINFINFADVPPEAKTYTGSKQMGFVTLGLLVPVVDVGIKAEVRGVFYGLSRLSLVTGIGVIIFL